MKTNSKQVLAENLDTLMRSHGINQVELAKRSERFGKGITQKTISNYVDRSRDSAANPTLEKIDILAKCFGIEPGLLISKDLKEAEDFQKLDDKLLISSLSDGVALLFEAGVISSDDAQLVLGISDDIAKATAIIYNGKSQDPNKIVFDFLAYLNERKASNSR